MPETPKGPRSVFVGNAELIPLVVNACASLARIADALEKLVELIEPDPALRAFELRERLSLGAREGGHP